MKQKIKNNPSDWTRSQVIATLHDNNISLVSLAKAYGLRGSSSMSIALTRNYPIGEKRIADALNLHPIQIWPSRYNADGTHKSFNDRYPAYKLPKQPNSNELVS